VTIYRWFVALSLLDVAITLIGLDLGAGEGGPIGRFGIGYGLGYKGLMILLFTVFREKKDVVDAMRILNWIMVGLLIWNGYVVWILIKTGGF